MIYFEIILLGIVLSLDASALTIANCTTYQAKLNKKQEWAMPITFALFQGVMPLIGYLIGSTFAEYIDSFADYLTAIIFFLLATKILFDIVKERSEGEKTENQPQKKFTLALLLVQGVATSIDALAIGITFSFETELSIFLSVSIIAVVTFVIVSASLIFGKYLGKLFGKYAEYMGMFILYALAIKSLLEAILG